MTQYINQILRRNYAAHEYAQKARGSYYYIRHHIFRLKNNVCAMRTRAKRALEAFIEKHPILASLSLLFSAPLAVLGFVFAMTAAIVIPVALLLGYAW